MRPNRALVIKDMASYLLNEFYDLNPMGKISVIGTMRNKAFMIGDFYNDKSDTLNKIQKIDDFEGNPSYQNALNFAMMQFDEIKIPDHIHKEVLIVNCSISINDPGDIFSTIERAAI